jgi:cytochrome c
MRAAVQPLYRPARGLRRGAVVGVAAACAVWGSGALAQGATGDPAHGQLLFQQRCGLCHTAGPQDGDGGQGPPLAGVVGRPAASAPNFSYTAALKASGRVWTPQALDLFLTAPGKDVPGTAMPLKTPSPKDRADLIAYLSTVKG